MPQVPMEAPSDVHEPEVPAKWASVWMCKFKFTSIYGVFLGGA